MVKIKDFTLASQNLGGGHLTPRALHTGRPWCQITLSKHKRLRRTDVF